MRTEERGERSRSCIQDYAAGLSKQCCSGSDGWPLGARHWLQRLCKQPELMRPSGFGDNDGSHDSGLPSPHQTSTAYLFCLEAKHWCNGQQLD